MNLKTLQQIRWEGYLRHDKSKGIRNKILVVYTVACSSYVAKRNCATAESFGYGGDWF